jgi:putative membrane protein
MSSGPASPADPRDYFAAERTYLAWIRTGLAWLTFGFVVARFESYLAEIELGPHASAQPGRFSLWTGTAFVFIGVATNLFATHRYLRTIRQLERGEVTDRRPSRAAVVLSLFLAAVGAAMAIRLILL